MEVRVNKIIRPQGIHYTPRNIARALNWETRYYPNPRLRPDYTSDFLMVAVDPRCLRNSPPEYTDVFEFASANKLGQRQRLHRLGLAIPATTGRHNQLPAGGRYVVRPLRHSRGVGYRVTESPNDFQEGVEYISALFKKKREYRVIFVFGKPLILLRKKPNEGVRYDQAWGHELSTFKTVNDWAASPLSGTDCLQRLTDCPIIKHSHIIAADILFNNALQQPWVVLEFNFCPGVTIDNNLQTVVEAIRAR